MEWMHSKRLILASGSPRRKELLAQAGFKFDVIVADIDEEDYPHDLPVHQLPVYLAREKAKKVFSGLGDFDGIILAADSLVFLKDTVFTKPVDRKNAIEIIQSLAGKNHTVITGLCLMYAGIPECESVKTEVFFEPMSLNEIEYYVDHYKPFDKAGAYGIQDWIGLCKVKSIQGSYSNIMGLPMETVYAMLERKMKSQGKR